VPPVDLLKRTGLDQASDAEESLRHQTPQRKIHQKNASLKSASARSDKARLSKQDEEPEQESRWEERQCSHKVVRLNERNYHNNAARTGNRQPQSCIGYESSPGDSSEYNLANSSNSTPEHAIHTVLAGARLLNDQTTARQSSTAEHHCRRNLFDLPQQTLRVSEDESDMTPLTPQKFWEDNNQDKQRPKETEPSPDNGVITYTNDNMSDLMTE